MQCASLQFEDIVRQLATWRKNVTPMRYRKDQPHSRRSDGPAAIRDAIAPRGFRARPAAYAGGVG